jgi:chromosomal replication initiator protein
MLQSFWKEILESLNSDGSGEKPVLHSFIKQLKPIEIKDDRLLLGCANAGLRFYLEKRLAEVEEIVNKSAKKKLKISLTIIVPKTKKEPPPLLSFEPSIEDFIIKAGLSRRYNFDNFAVSTTNQVAYAAAQAVVDNLGSAYNPLFLYGGVGVGKTHLAQAVGRKILENNNKKKVCFSPGDLFTNELIESIREKSTMSFRKKYRKLDLLIIDDVQFIAGKQAVQEEFFHTFNSVITFGGQIILTSDRPPTEIKNLEDRLRSRFSGGLTIDIQPPDFELRSAILLIKAREKNIDLDIEAAKIIAERIGDSRALEGTLLSIYAKIIGKQEKITPETANSFFSSEIEKKVKKISPNDVVRAVCSFYNIRQSKIKSDTRESQVVLPRQLIMYILRFHLNLKLDQVAYFLKRKDHTTVIHANDKISRMLAKDPGFKQGVDSIVSSLGLST